MGTSAIGRGTAIEENRVKASSGDGSPDFLDGKIGSSMQMISDLMHVIGGTSGDVLTAQGAGVAPTMQTPAGGGAYSFISSATFTTAVTNSIVQTIAPGEIFLLIWEGVVNTSSYTPDLKGNGASNDHRFSLVANGHSSVGAFTSGTASDNNVETTIHITDQSDGNLDNWDVNSRFLVEVVATAESTVGSDTQYVFRSSMFKANSASFVATGIGQWQGGAQTSLLLNRASGTGTLTGRQYVYQYNTA